MGTRLLDLVALCQNGIHLWSIRIMSVIFTSENNITVHRLTLALFRVKINNTIEINNLFMKSV